MDTGFDFAYEYDEDVRWITMGEAVEIPAGEVTLGGSLVIPQGAGGLVVLAQGLHWDESELETLTDIWHDHGLATLAVRLLSDDEIEGDTGPAGASSDVSLQTRRLLDVVEWACATPQTAELKLGFFAAHTAAAAPVTVAALKPDVVEALALHDARLDLVDEALAKVAAPTLLMVEGTDKFLVEVNERARLRLAGPRQFAVIEPPPMLADGPGPLRDVARLAGSWFSRFL